MSDVSKLSSYAEKLSLEAKQSLNKLQPIGSVDPSWIGAKDYTCSQHASCCACFIIPCAANKHITQKYSSRQINLCQHTTSPPATLNIVTFVYLHFPRQVQASAFIPIVVLTKQHTSSRLLCLTYQKVCKKNYYFGIEGRISENNATCYNRTVSP